MKALFSRIVRRVVYQLGLSGLVDLVRISMPFAREVLRGIRVFRKTGITPESSYQALIQLFCLTRGYSNDFLHWLTSLSHSCYRVEGTGILGEVDTRGMERVMSEFRRDGLYVFRNRLPDYLVDRLVAFARSQPCVPIKDGAKFGPRLYDPLKPVANRYNFFERDLVQNEAVQTIMSDPSFLRVAQAYFGCAPVIDLVAMWWLAKFGDKPDDNAAQLFHFDMDRIKWVKFFIYLTNVTLETGPTYVVRGSHRRGNPPRELLRRGYARIPDRDLERYYDLRDIVPLTCPRGTVVLVDTRAFHKGSVVRSGERLAFEVEFCGSLFGGAYERPEISLMRESSLAAAQRRYPRVYSKYTYRYVEREISFRSRVASGA